MEIIAGRLRNEAGLSPWLEAWDLVPGTPRQEAKEAALAGSACCAVLVGSVGLSSWQHEKTRAALDTRVSSPDYRVIPVPIPGTELPERGGLPPFLCRYAWVDFSTGHNHPDEE